MSQSSTFTSGDTVYNAENAIDSDLTTTSHTNCAWDTDLWYKIKFDAVYCFSDVFILQSHRDQNAYRMDDMEVFAVNTDTGTESRCGVLKVSDILMIEGQTYRIPCDLKCGDEVKLAVRHDRGTYKRAACIHMTEIEIFQRGLQLLGTALTVSNTPLHKSSF